MAGSVGYQAFPFLKSPAEDVSHVCVPSPVIAEGDLLCTSLLGAWIFAAYRSRICRVPGYRNFSPRLLERSVRPTMGLAGVNVQAQREQKQRQDECLQQALFSGMRSSLIALAASGSMTYLLNHASEAFKYKFPVSVKTTFVVLAPFYTFWSETERSILRCRLKIDNPHMNLDKLAANRQADMDAAES